MNSSADPRLRATAAASGRRTTGLCPAAGARGSAATGLCPAARPDPWLMLLFAVGAFLLLTHLGNGRLWQDEAETAVLGKNILRFGYPRAFDGVNRLNPSPIVSLGPGEAWTYHPWFSFYTAGLFFFLFGADTAVARLPFALMGLGSILLAYRVVRQITQSVPLARWTSTLLTLSVPFLLHMRQCRYYAPSVLFSLWAVSAYWRLQGRAPLDPGLTGRGRGAVLELISALVLLFHSNHGVFLPVASSLALHGFFLQPDRQIRAALLKIAAWAVPWTLPFFFLLQAGQHHSAFSWEEIRHHAQFYFRQINHYVLPVTLWLLLLPFWRPKAQCLFGPPTSIGREGFRFVGLFLAVNLLFLVFVPTQRHFRYLIPLFPFFFLLQALFLRDLIQSRRGLGLTALLLMTFTDLHYIAPYLLSGKPSSPRCLLSEFLGEMTHPYRGPVDGIVELLQREGKPGETVKIPYEDHAVLFYTRLNVEPIPRPEDFLHPTQPEWVIPRRDWIPGDFFQSGYFSQIQGSYEEIVLDVPDIPWQNRPDPGYHKFRTDRSAPPVRVFRRRNL